MLVNCAGWSISGKFEDISMDDVKVNLYGTNSYRVIEEF